MKRSIKLSAGLCLIITIIALLSPSLASAELVLRFLPTDIYEAGKDHPKPALPKRIICHLLTLLSAVYMIWALRTISDDIRRDGIGFKEAYGRLLAFFLTEKAYDIIVLDQILCMSTGFYRHFYPETKDCTGWKDRKWNMKAQSARLVFYPVLCAVCAYLLTRKKDCK